MRILHTSDWHLGQHFISKSREAEHSAFIDWLLQQVREQEIDAVIIAGDLFDTGAPPSYARKLFNRFIVEISRIGCQLIALAGNHDSVATLSESKQLVEEFGVRVIANVTDDLEQQIVTLNDRHGKPGAVLCAVPFIRPRDVVSSQADQSGEDKQRALGEAIKKHYADLYALAEAKRSDLALELPIVATGHLTAMGVKSSDSVRDIYIGSLEAVPSTSFPPADYIALGHIHRPQIVAQSEHIRYCGSPIPLSFDELGTQKQVLIAEFSGSNLSTITPLNVPLFQPMRAIKGDLSSIEAQLQSLSSDEAHSDNKPTWLYIEVETQDYLNDLQQRIQAMTTELNVEVLQLCRSRSKSGRTLEQAEKETLTELTPEEVFLRRLDLESFDGEAEQQRRERICQRFTEIAAEVDAQQRGLEAER